MFDKIGKQIINSRFAILIVLGATVYFLTAQLHISVWYIILAGVVSGILFGKVFCRWACPVGIIMEIMMSSSGDVKTRQLYQYHKLGCPIAWVQGLLNRVSLFKIHNKSKECRECGICDKKCYIVAVDPEKYSLFKEGKKNPALSYTCSRCLSCVASCPAGSLKYGVKL